MRFRNFVKRWMSTPLLEMFLGLVLCANLVTIGLESAMSRDGRAPPELAYLEYGFTMFYTLELIANLFVHGPIVVKHLWFQVDACVVIFGIVEVLVSLEGSGNVMIVRVLRMARLGRAARFFRHCRPAYLLLQGMWCSVETLFWTFIIMLILIYIFGIVGLEVMTQDLSDDAEYQIVYQENFSSLGVAMLFLMRALTLDSVGAVYTPVIKVAPHLLVYFVLFILLASVSLMNLVTAVMVEAARKQAVADSEAAKVARRARYKTMRPQLDSLFEELDPDGSGMIELSEMLNASTGVQQRLTEITDRCDIEEIFNTIDYDSSGTVSKPEFIDGIMRTTDERVPLEVVRIMRLCVDNRRALTELLEYARASSFDWLPQAETEW